MNIKNKWALITGASRGVGKEIAMAMAAEGCNLILHSRSIEHTKQLAAELKDIKVFQIEGDLSDVSVAEKIADEAVGPSMALGSQVVNGNCADLIAAGKMIMHTIKIAVPVCPAAAAMSFASPSSEKLIFRCVR